MGRCALCEKQGLMFDRKYEPEDFIEGKLTSKIWIIGLNPKEATEYIDTRDKVDLDTFFDNKDSLKPQHKKIYSYFKDFKTASNNLYSLLGKDNGVCHTDIVKCFSNTFPHAGVTNKQKNEIINNCSCYLKEQIKKYKPKLIICNGADTSNLIQKIITPINGQSTETSYIGLCSDNVITVILSGFIGRIDNYAKRRLGIEIEKAMETLNLVTTDN